MKELQTDLETNKYSLIKDIVAASGTSIFDLKVRYLKQYEGQISFVSNKPSITESRYQNKIVAMKYLEDNSEAEPSYLFSNSNVNFETNIKIK